MRTILNKLRGYFYIYYVGGYAYWGRNVSRALIAFGVVLVFSANFGSRLFLLSGEFIGIGVAMLVVDSFCERRAKKELKTSLNKDLSGEGNSLVLRAVRKLKRYSNEYKWLFDGSLDGRDFRHSNLYRVNLHREVDLRVRVRYADFFYSNFGNAYLFNVDFSGSSFRNVQFDDAAFSWVKFNDCKFNGASFKGAKLVNTDFTGSDVTIRQLVRAKEIQRIKLPDGRLIYGRGDLYLALTK